MLDGVIGIGTRLNMPTAIIGLVLVSLGTSAPELFVSVGSALQGHGGLAAGNVVGSNNINISIVLGITICVAVLHVEKMLQQQMIAVLVISLLATWVVFDGHVSRLEGLCLIITMIISFIFAVKNRNRNEQHVENGSNSASASIKHLSLLTMGGLVALLVGAESLIWGGLALANRLNLSETVIALTVTALGTSLPEIAASVVAIVKRQTSLALGNVIGSNLLNIGLVLGVSAAIVPLGNIDLDLPTLVFFVGLILSILLLSFKPGYLPRWSGYLLVISYFAYVAILLNF